MLAMLLALGCGIALGAQDESNGPADDSTVNASLPAEPGPEVKADRTETSQTFRLPDGGLETRIFANPINYRDSEGEWQPIEEGLEEQPNGSGLTNGTNSFSVALPQQLGAEPVRLSSEDGWVSTELLGTELESTQLEGEDATYESADGETTFDFASLPNGLKEDIEIASVSAPSTFNFAVDASAGVTPALAEDGSVEFRDESGQLVATMPAPSMSDSTPGDPAESRDVHYSLEPQGDHWTLTVQADRKWLEEPARSWPVSIDPTTTELSPTLDCSFLLYGTSTTSNACGSKGSQRLKAQYQPATSEQTSERERSVLKFDTSAIPSSVYVTGATVGLFAPWEPLNIAGIELRRVSKEWNSSVNWFKTGLGGGHSVSEWTTPGGDFTSEGAEILSSERKEMEGWWKFSKGLEPIVEGWISGKMANLGLLMKLKNEEGCQPPSCKDSWATFNSSAATESGTHPYLSVTYLPKAPASSKIVSPIEGTISANRLKLKSKWAESGVTGITFEYKTAQNRFLPIPGSLIHNGAGEEPKWPMAVSGFESESLYFEAGRANSELTEKGGEVEIRANFTAPKGIEGYSEAAKPKSTLNWVALRTPPPRPAREPSIY
jgi:hypothetical protein